MNIKIDNKQVNSNIKSVTCNIKSETVILRPNEAESYLGSVTRYKILNKGIILTGGNVKVIDTELSNNISWCLIDYNGYYYYTPSEYIDLSKYIKPAENETNEDLVSSLKMFKGPARAAAANAETDWINKGRFNTVDSAKLGEIVDNSYHFYNYPASKNVSDYGTIANQDYKVGDYVPLQSYWYNKREAKYYYATTAFAPNPTETHYIPESAVKIVSPSKYTKRYTICWRDTKDQGSTGKGLITKNGVQIASLNLSQILSTICDMDDGDTSYLFYQQPGNSNIHLVRAASTQDISPYVHDRNVLNKSYLGIVYNGKKSAGLTTHINTGMLRSSKGFKRSGSIKHITLDDLRWFVENSGNEQNNAKKGTYDDVDLKFVASKNRSYSGSSDSVFNDHLVTVNKIKVNGWTYFVCFAPGLTFDWFLIHEEIEDIWCALPYKTYEMIKKEVDEAYPPYKEVKDNTTYTTNNNSNIDSYDNSLTYTKDNGGPQLNPNTGEFEEWSGEYTIKNSNTEWNVPGIDPNAPTIDQADDLWIHLSDAMSYELQDEDIEKHMQDDRPVKMINRFRLLTREDGPIAGKSFIFVTRPDLNLYKEITKDANPYNDTIDTWNMNPDLKRLPTFKYIARLKNACRSIMPSLEYWGTNELDTPWLSILTNQAMSYNVKDREIDTVELGETFHGSKIIYAEPTFKHKIAGNIEIQFRERRDLALYYTLKLWIEYIHMVSIGRCSPRRVHRYNHELDYAVSLYYIRTDESMEKIIYWEKLTGLIPLTVPDGFFDWDQGGQPNSTYTINFAYSFRTVQDEMHLTEINSLYNKWGSIRKGCGVAYDDYNYSYNPDYNSIMAKVAQSYGIIPDNEAKLKSFINSQESMKRFYYGSKAATSATDNYDYTHKHYYCDENGYANKEINSIFLPNYIPQIGMHGIPYVKGPFITKEPNMTQGNLGAASDDGHYRLRWV